MRHELPALDTVPRAAYVHVPFCRHRCGYCNFTVVAGRDDLIEEYLRAIEIELRTLPGPQPVDTLFCGGGTPSHLAPEQLRQFLEIVTHWFPLRDRAEFSVEANPEDVDPEKVDLLASFGVNRVSLGMQSLSPAKLKRLERSHIGRDVLRCFELLRPRVPSLSVDLIFAAPGESLQVWAEDLQATIRLSPDHVSTYGLTYERGTRFFGRLQRDALVVVPEQVQCEMYEMAMDLLSAAGFEHYEVSNFARPRHRCRHNESYWRGAPYFGIGPGAASYLAGERRLNHRSTTTYLRRVLAGQSPISETERLGVEDRARERLVLGLRRIEGVEQNEFLASTGYDLRQLMGPHLEPFLKESLLYWSGESLRLTRKGLLVSDSLWPYLLRC